MNEEEQEQRDRQLVGEAISAVGQCTHIIGADAANAIIGFLSIKTLSEAQSDG